MRARVDSESHRGKAGLILIFYSVYAGRKDKGGQDA